MQIYNIKFSLRTCEVVPQELVFGPYLYIYSHGVSLFVSNKLQNGWTDRAHIFGGTSHYPRKGLWMIKILKNLLIYTLFFLSVCSYPINVKRLNRWVPILCGTLHDSGNTYDQNFQCFGSISFWFGSGSADPHPWWWIRIRIRGNFWFCESDFPY